MAIRPHLPPSTSENNGIKFLCSMDKNIYSVGISTGGAAEARMAANYPECRIIATTLDHHGAKFAQNQIDQLGLTNQIKIKIEDVTHSLPYSEGYFDYVYARLVLHYLPKNFLQKALGELYRILKVGGKIFIVVRSTKCLEAQDSASIFDPNTRMTTYLSDGTPYSRYFHTQESIQNHITLAGFSIQHTESYHEQLCSDFERTNPSKHIDNLIEVLAIK